MFLALKVILLIFVTVSAGVAPGDEEPLCEQLRSHGAAPIPAYSANMRVLMDSWNYQNLLPFRTGAVWEQVDNDVNNPSGITTNWIQQSNTPCIQFVQVCGFTAGQQNNWLFTQLINRTVNGTRLSQVSVMIEFELRDCYTALNCQRTFNTHVYETSSKNTSPERNDYRNYQQVQRVSTDITTGDRVNKTIAMNFRTNHSSFYFAIQDETSCIVITRLIIFYTVCPAQTANLIHFPEAIASSNIHGLCVENAQSENGLASLVTCLVGGVWNIVPGAGCRCVPGYFRENISCIPCPAGTYQSSINGLCLDCPANSVSEEEGLTQCTCVEGYYRLPQEGVDLPCTLLPSHLMTPHHESVTTFEGNSSMVEMMEESYVNPELIIAAVIPSLFSLALVLALSILSVLFYLKTHKKHNEDYGNQEVTYEEIQKSSADHAFNMDAVKMEKNSAYGSKSMCVKDMTLIGEDMS